MPGKHFTLEGLYRGPEDIPRIFLGVIFLLAAFIKNLDPFFFLQVLSTYRKLPLQGFAWIGYPVVFGIILMEYGVGLGALLNIFPRLAIAGAFGLNVLFTGVLAVHWGERLPLGCGCFGFAKDTIVGPSIFWKNGILLGVTLAAAWFSCKNNETSSTQGAQGVDS